MAGFSLFGLFLNIPSSTRMFLEPTEFESDPVIYLKDKSGIVTAVQDKRLKKKLLKAHRRNKFGITLQAQENLPVAVNCGNKNIILILEKTYSSDGTCNFLSLFDVPNNQIQFIHERAKMAIAVLGQDQLIQNSNFFLNSMFNNAIASTGYKVVRIQT